jgi:hypothetical protein
MSAVASLRSARRVPCTKAHTSPEKASGSWTMVSITPAEEAEV